MNVGDLTNAVLTNKPVNKHKTKLFKKVFMNNADCYADTDGKEVTPAMTQETFVPLMGQMWWRAKQKYKNKYKKEAIEFAKYISERTILKEFPEGNWEDIFNNWKNNKS